MIFTLMEIWRSFNFLQLYHPSVWVSYVRITPDKTSVLSSIRPSIHSLTQPPLQWKLWSIYDMRGIIVSPVDVDTVVNKTEFASLMSLLPSWVWILFWTSLNSFIRVLVMLHLSWLCTFVSTSGFFWKIEWFLIHDLLCLVWSSVSI